MINTDTNTLMIEIQDRIKDLHDSVQDDMKGAVEVGSTLAVLIKEASVLQDGLKRIIREEAVRQLKDLPGTTTFGGNDRGSVSVTVPATGLQMVKDVDVGLLFKVLGNDFDLYFETNVKYVPRKVAPALIELMEDGTPKTILLSSLQENEGTPRVSFKRT